jgi:deazaflavin-dependent oxidoreductase (nitroreductase family)
MTVIDGVAHIVASNFGGKNHPAWSYNLDANPRATMQLGSEPIDVTAELLSDAEISDARRGPFFGVIKQDAIHGWGF